MQHDIFDQSYYLFGANSLFIEELYERYLKDKNSVDASWQQFFAGIGDAQGKLNASWGRNDEKIIGVCCDDPGYTHYDDLHDLPEHHRRQLDRFFLDYKVLEHKKVETMSFMSRDEAVAVIRDDGTCIRVNHALCSLSGYDMMELLGRPIHTLLEDEVPVEDQPEVNAEPPAAGRKSRRENQIITRFGRCRSVDVIREPDRD